MVLIAYIVLSLEKIVISFTHFGSENAGTPKSCFSKLWCAVSAGRFFLPTGLPYIGNTTRVAVAVLLKYRN